MIEELIIAKLRESSSEELVALRAELRTASKEIQELYAAIVELSIVKELSDKGYYFHDIAGGIAEFCDAIVNGLKEELIGEPKTETIGES